MSSKKIRRIVDDVQNVYAAQVFDAVTVKVSFISQEISKIEHIQSQHQASDLQLVVPTSVKTIRLRAVSYSSLQSYHMRNLSTQAARLLVAREKRGRKPEKKK